MAQRICYKAPPSGRGTLQAMRRVLLGAGLVGAALLAAGAALVLLNLTVFGEASVPARDDLPDLPAGLTMANETEGCGSGSCYREFDIEGGPGDTPRSILDRLPSEEECTRRSLVDWRPLCVGYRLGPEAAEGYVSLGKWQG